MSTASPTFVDPAETLTGTIIDKVWEVGARKNLSGITTGGMFSTAYEVINTETGQKAWMKALSISQLLQATGDVIKSMSLLGSAHQFEVEILTLCDGVKLDRIVKALHSGELRIPSPPIPFPLPVPYIIFEHAEYGDFHKVQKLVDALDYRWKLNTLHQVSVGLLQLHRHGITHRDLKPSNLLFFETTDAKLGDLGRASSENNQSGPNENLPMACQAMYAPPEHVYGHTPASRDERHFSADLYHLGSLCFSFFTSFPLTPTMLLHLPEPLRPDNPYAGHFRGQFSGPYQDVILPLKRAFSACLVDLRASAPASIAEDLVELVGQLCNPDPKLRGHPKDHATAVGKRFSVQRYVSKIKNLANRLPALVK